MGVDVMPYETILLILFAVTVLIWGYNFFPEIRNRFKINHFEDINPKHPRTPKTQ